jgi:hypothetical protein
LGTVNGTRLNGAVLKGERPLEDRDVLRLGDVTAIYRVVRTGKTPSDLIEPKAGPERLNTTMPIASASDIASIPCFGGDVAQYPMEELLGRLTALRATGTLRVDVDGVLGTVRFEKGRAAESRYSGHEGDGAFRIIANLRRGRVSFEGT